MAEKEYIDRDAVVKEIRAAQRKLESNDDNLWEINKPYFKGLAWAHRIVLDAPAAAVAPVVQAVWSENKYPYCNYCPRCGLIISRTCIMLNSGKLNYCPNCGAKMKGGADNG